jgi:uncharacterized protein with gpF-like domain
MLGFRAMSIAQNPAAKKPPTDYSCRRLIRRFNRLGRFKEAHAKDAKLAKNAKKKTKTFFFAFFAPLASFA